jgi:tetratricopeptide (TPR) repeat protein
MGNQDCEAQALNDLGATLLQLGDPDNAVRLHDTALVIAAELGDPYEQARSHDGSAAALLAAGHAEAARSELSLALSLYGELHTPEAAEVAQRSAALGEA